MGRMLALLGVLIFGQAQDKPEKPPAEEYQDRLARIKEALASEHFGVGEYLAGMGMHRWARDEYRKALSFNANHAETRKRLGYVMKDGEWEPDQDAAMETENKKKGDDEVKARQDYDKKAEALGKKIGRMWGDTGNFCDRNKMKAEAEAAWRLAIEYDPMNSESRKKLGFTRQKDGPWLSPFEVKIRKEFKEGIAKAPGGSPSKEQTEVEADLGWKHEKRKSKNFLIQAPKEQDWLMAEIKHAEHAYAMFHKVFNQKEDLFQTPFLMVVAPDKAAHERYVDRYFQGGDSTYREFAKKATGWGGYPRGETTLGNRPDLHDWVVHSAAEDLFAHLVGGRRPWMREGVAYHFTKSMLSTANTMCVNLAGTGSGGEKNLQNPEDWPLVIRTWIKESKDPSIAEVFKCREVAELSGAETVKGWSIIDFLMTEHRDKFLDYCSKLRGQKEEEDEKTLQEVFGWTLEDLDLRWKTYARASY
jgi:hypothetical protein